MEKRTKTTAMVLAGSVALASTAYAIGSQSGDGTSGAATRSSAAARGPGQTLAQRLGVSEAKLRAAFEAIRKDETPPADPRKRLVTALADALGLSQDKVSAALDDLRKQHEADEADRRAAFAKSLAGELGIDAGKVTAALDKLHPARAGARRFRGGPAGGPPGLGAPPDGGRREGDDDVDGHPDGGPPHGAPGFASPSEGDANHGGPPPGGPGFGGPPPGAPRSGGPPPRGPGVRGPPPGAPP